MPMAAKHPCAIPRTCAGVSTTLRRSCRDPADVPTHLYHNITVNEDRAAGLDEAKRFLDTYYSLDYSPKFVSCWTAAGSPDECVEHLRVYKELGFDEVTLRIAGWDQFGQLKRVMEEVLPRV